MFGQTALGATDRHAVYGIYAKFGAIVVFAAMDTLVKWLGSGYPVSQVLLFRSAFAFLPLIVMMSMSVGVAALRTRQPGWQVMRTIFGLLATFGFFWAFPRAPLVDVYAISFAAPFFMAALSIPILGESVGWRRWSAIGVGFLGVMIILNPGAGVGIVSFVTLGATLLYAFNIVVLRRIARTDRDESSMFYYGTACMLVFGGLCLVDPDTHWRDPVGWDWLWLAAVGLMGGVGQIFSTRALRLAPPSVLAPFEYTAIVFAFAFGWIFFHELPGDSVWYGLPLVIGSGLYILYRESVRARAGHQG